MALNSLTTRLRRIATNREARNGLLSLTQAVLTLVVYFLVMRQIVVVIGLESLGLWSLTASLVAFVRMLDLGGAQVLSRLVATETGREVDQARIIDTAALFGFAAFLVFAVAAYFGLRPVLLNSVEFALRSEASWLLLGLVLTLPVNVLGLVHLGALDGIGRADLRASVAIAALVIYALAALVLIRSQGVMALVYAQGLQHVFTIVAARNVLHTRLAPLAAFPRYFSVEKLRRVVSFGGALQASLLPMAIFDPLCRLLIGRSAGLELLGVYELASKFAASARTLVQAFTNPILPEFARALVDEEEAAQRRFNASQPMISAGAMVVSVVQLLALPVVSYVLLNALDPAFMLVAAALSFAWGLSCIGVVAQLYARAAGRMHYTMIGQWSLLGLGAVLVPLASVLGDGLWILVAPSLAILVGHLIAFIGEIRYFRLAPFGEGQAVVVLGAIFALSLVACAIIAVSLSLMEPSQ
ncbi:MAG: oligosaccharide flippase family protein [Pseudomonadota bacterium]